MSTVTAMSAVDAPSRSTTAVRCYVALGANLGDSIASVCAAAKRIASLPAIENVVASSLYQSAPREIRALQPDYINAVVGFASKKTPQELWLELSSIETALGRLRSGTRNEARKIDIDFLLYGGTILNTPELVLPHPRMTQRAFVLRPLLEIAPEVEIPGFGRAASLLGAVSDQVIRRLDKVALCS